MIATPTFRSERGYSLAVRIAEELDRDFGPVEACGRAYGILRETRMAAVETSNRRAKALGSWMPEAQIFTTRRRGMSRQPAK